MWQLLKLLSALLVLHAPLAGAQVAIPTTVADPEPQGVVKNPEVFSIMTAMFQGRLDYVDKGDLKGPVATVERDELQSVAQNPNPFHRTVKIKFDEGGRPLERIDEDLTGISTTIWSYKNGQVESAKVNHHSTIRKQPDWEDWRHWVYDSEDQLVELRAGRDKQEMNHFLNFAHDEKKRLTGYEYRKQGSGNAFIYTKIKYVGSTVVTSQLDPEGREVYEQVQVLDDSGRVADLKVSDLSAGHLKLWYHVKFKYDDKSRVTEQHTDYPQKLGEGDDYIPAPGRLATTYDDVKHTAAQEFFEADGKLSFRTIAQLDHDGTATNFKLFDPSGKERIGGESFWNPQTKQFETRAGSIHWEVAYDDSGNWTERKRWFTPADDSPPVMVRSIRQTITYRSSK